MVLVTRFNMKCTYCGSIADSRDHVVPASTQYVQDRKFRPVPTNRHNTVPACRLCNSMLGANGGHTVGSRANFLVERYKKRYARVLRLPYWGDAEIDRLGKNLRSFIRKDKALKDSAQVMIENCAKMADIAPTIAEVWSAVDEYEKTTRPR